jgi:hypothetical protein
MWPSSLMTMKYLMKIMWLSYLLTMNVPDEDYVAFLSDDNERT